MTWSGTFNTWPQMGEAGYQGGDCDLTFFFLFLPTEPRATSDIGAVSIYSSVFIVPPMRDGCRRSLEILKTGGIGCVYVQYCIVL